MTYILLKTDKTNEGLTPVDAKPLMLKQSLNLLLAGKTLVIKGYETTSKADVFARLNLIGDSPLTEISYSSPDSDQGAVWDSYPLPFNVLSLYDVYEYDANLYTSIVYYPGDTVKYRTDTGIQAGVVNAVYLEGKDLYYDINGTIYSVGIIPDMVNTQANIAGTTAKIPVADVSADYHTIDVSDYQNTVYVLF